MPGVIVGSSSGRISRACGNAHHLYESNPFIVLTPPAFNRSVTFGQNGNYSESSPSEHGLDRLIARVLLHFRTL